MEDNYNKIKAMRDYAVVNKVPIMEEEGIKYLTNFIIKNSINSVLEIGSAIGYSSIMMALCNPKLHIVTIERDQDRYMEALKNIKNFNLEDRITLIFKDALDVSVSEKFDLIFIDAAKGQNINFFNKFSNNLNDGGYIITDNMNFHGLVNKDESEIESRNLRQLIRKIKEYKVFLESNENYTTEFLEIGDGLAVTTQNK